ncbi:hypothetical protein MADA3029_1140094 [Vibrio nigripulchritudo MADA3029]|nr:hypothetical protein VIBNIMADA3020_10095 [Vibrio nigripulchritudo MADA3020]CCN54490.1 hypothetical protein VIBNIMADA3021_550094 [Vibrio nigripulchritudo MADA3021]CCN57540.1 hypothetical protein MADA3029_1140094 [Vibrio nigripulchritudo MADA3029]
MTTFLKVVIFTDLRRQRPLVSQNLSTSLVCSYLNDIDVSKFLLI